MKKHVLILLLLVLVILAACTAGQNTVVDIPSESGRVAGFFLGLWHGFIAPVTFVISLFIDKISLYEIYNSGGWYDFGFVLGAGILFGGGGNAAKKRNKHRNYS